MGKQVGKHAMAFFRLLGLMLVFSFAAALFWVMPATVGAQTEHEYNSSNSDGITAKDDILIIISGQNVEESGDITWADKAKRAEGEVPNVTYKEPNLTIRAKDGITDPSLILTGDNKGFWGKVTLESGTLELAEYENLPGKIGNFSFDGDANDLSSALLTKIADYKAGTANYADLLAIVNKAKSAGSLPTLKITGDFFMDWADKFWVDENGNLITLLDHPGPQPDGNDYPEGYDDPGWANDNNQWWAAIGKYNKRFDDWEGVWNDSEGKQAERMILGENKAGYITVDSNAIMTWEQVIEAQNVELREIPGGAISMASGSVLILEAENKVMSPDEIETAASAAVDDLRDYWVNVMHSGVTTETAFAGMKDAYTQKVQSGLIFKGIRVNMGPDHSGLYLVHKGAGGGAIYNDGGILMIKNAYFEGNVAGHAHGGAIANNGGTLILKDSSFVQNEAGYLGGAIANINGSVVLETSEGRSSLFMGNLGYGNTDAGPKSKANSIGFWAGDENTASLLVLTAKDSVLDMRDPLWGEIDKENGGTISIEKKGEGTWKLGGLSYFEPKDPDAGNEAPLTGTVSTHFTVSEGTLYLYAEGEEPNSIVDMQYSITVREAGIVGMTGENSTFTLGSKGILELGGKNAVYMGVLNSMAEDPADWEIEGDPEGSIIFEDGATIRAGGGTIDTNPDNGYDAEDPATWKATGQSSLVLSAAETEVLGTLNLEVGLMEGGTTEKTFSLDATLTGDKGLLVKTGGGELQLAKIDSLKGISGLDLREGSVTTSQDQEIKKLTIAENAAFEMTSSITLHEGEVKGNLTLNGGGIVDTLDVKGGSLTIENNSLGVKDANFADGTTLNSGATLNASGDVTFGTGTTLNITQYQEGELELVTAGSLNGTENLTVQLGGHDISSDPSIDHGPSGFIIESAEVTASAITLNSSLAWNSDDPALAHGTFNIKDGHHVTISSPLLAKDGNNGDWNGKDLTKTGGGLLELVNNDSAGISVPGNIKVQAGELKLNSEGITGASEGFGEAGSTITVESGAILSGNFNYNGSLTINGTLQPGNSIGTITIADSITFSSGSYYDVELGKDNSGLISDRITAGNAEILGGTVRVTAYQAASGDLIGTYTIVQADRITGTFSGVDNKLALLDVELGSATKDGKQLVTLKVVKEKSIDDLDNDPKLPPGAIPGTRNQRSVGGAYDSLPSGDLKSAIITAAGSNPAQFFDMLSGEIHPSLQGLLQDSDRRLAAKLRARTIDREKAPKGSPLWINVDGYSSRTDRTSSTASTKLEGFEANLGAEMNKTEWTAGAVLRYADSDVKAGRRNSKAEIQSLGAGLYAGRNWDNFYLSFGATFAFHDVETKRGVAGNNFYQRLDGDYDVKTFQLFSEVGYFMPILDNLVLGPYAGLSWNSAENESFTEKGGNMALHAKNESNENLVSTVGVRAKTKALDKFSIEADLNWQHIYDEVNPESRFFLNGSDQFSVWGAPMNRDSVGLSLNATMKLTPSLNIRAGYDGRFGNSAEAHAGGLTLEFSF